MQNVIANFQGKYRQFVVRSNCKCGCHFVYVVAACHIVSYCISVFT